MTNTHCNLSLTACMAMHHNATTEMFDDLTEDDMSAADEAIWNADPTVPDSEKFHEITES